MSEKFKCDECGKTFDSEKGLYIHIGEMHPEKKEEILSEEEKKQTSEQEEKEQSSEEEEKEEKEKKQTSSEIFNDPLKIGAIALIIALALGSILVVTQVKLGPTDQDKNENSFTASDAGERALKLMKSLPQLQGADLNLINSSKTGSGVYKMNIELSAQGQTRTITQYETKDGKLLFPSGQKIEGADSKKVTKEEAGNSAVKPVRNYFKGRLMQYPNASLSGVSYDNSSGIKSGIYELNMEVTISSQDQKQTQAMKTYMTTDGKYFFNQMVNISKQMNLIEKQAKPIKFDAPDKEKPTVELYVQSFCPYGNQAENQLKEVYNLLGDQVNWEHHFIVSERNGKINSLHGEKEVAQNKRELCVIDQNGMAKWFEFATYVNNNCGSGGGCWKEAANDSGLNPSEIQSCVTERGKELLKKEANKTIETGIRASPTLLINGEKKPTSSQRKLVIEGDEFNPGSQRTPQAYKQVICSGFAEKPDVCSQSLNEKGSSSSKTC